MPRQLASLHRPYPPFLQEWKTPLQLAREGRHTEAAALLERFRAASGGEADSPWPGAVAAAALSRLVHAAPLCARRNILGDALYFRISLLLPERAPKITGMLLELREEEALLVMGTPGRLESVVAEAVAVLEAAWRRGGRAA